MPLLSSSLLLRTRSLALVTFAYYLLTAPSQLLSSTPIWLLGESMSLRPASYAPEPQLHDVGTTTSNRLSSLITGHGSANASAERELCALLAVTLVVYAVMNFLFAGDLTATLLLPSSRDAKPSSGSRGSGVTSTMSSPRWAEELHTLLTAQSRWLSLAGLHVLGASVLVAWIYSFHSQSQQSLPSSSLSGFGLLANRVTFTAALVDMLFWGYLWTVLKDEGRDVAKALARRREFEDDGDE
ncbi:hypothetical protein PV04_00110 [Phialophora macrospora]|uniref:Uncharacterized protein n=1 Tax=Phialophora macrospora TaxID=1851006 RepID=A0A0D2D329_9EURO|nr:hypothetical protein PV04_00110 [Phialophora macrospora]